MAARAAKRMATGPSSRVVLSPVLRYDNPWHLRIPNHLSLGNDGQLYLTHAPSARSVRIKPLLVTLKESVAWCRLLHECSLHLTQESRFGDWLKLIEKALPATI